MADKFKNLKKLPAEPAARLLANAQVKLKTKITAPASAPIPAVLAELDAAEGIPARIDTLRLLSVALPPRESVWWACLAARDYLGEKAKPTKALEAAEAWVYRPGEETRHAAIHLLEHADPDDDTMFCAMAVAYSDGTLGTGELAQIPAPPGGPATPVFAMNAKTLEGPAEIPDIEAHLRFLIDRGLDIARGGNGQIPRPTAKEKA